MLNQAMGVTLLWGRRNFTLGQVPARQSLATSDGQTSTSPTTRCESNESLSVTRGYGPSKSPSPGPAVERSACPKYGVITRSCGCWTC